MSRKPKRDDPAKVEDIVTSAALLDKYISTFESVEDLIRSETIVRDAIERRLGIISEAASTLSDEFKKKHKNIDWNDIKGFRNIIIHDYWSLDPNVMWNILLVHIPELVKEIEGD